MKSGFKFWHIVLCGLVLIGGIACKDEMIPQDENVCASEPRRIHALYEDDIDGQAALYNMPLASITELDYFANADETIIPYRLARQYAYIELMGNAQSLLPENAYNALTLAIVAEDDSLPIAFTNRPAIVYNYDDTPYYYEFGVIWGEQLLTVVTIYAHKMSDQLIAYVGAANYVDYDFEYKRYVGIYPAVYYGDNNNMLLGKPVWDEYGVMSMEAVSEPSPLSTNPSTLFNLALSQIPQADLAVMNEDLQAQTDETLDEFGISISSIPSYQSFITVMQATKMDNLNNFLNHLANDIIPPTNKFQLTDSQLVLVRGIMQYSQPYSRFLSEYRDYQLRFTHWERYCGPAAMAWLYRGKWASFRGQYLPLYGEGNPNNNDSIELRTVTGHYSYYTITNANIDEYGGWVEASAHVDNGLCGVWYQYCYNLLGEYPLFPCGMKRGLEEATADKETPYTTAYTLLPKGWICNEKEPVVIACIPESEPHYLAVIGVIYNSGFMGLPKDIMFLVTDNGDQIGAQGYYPYWKSYEWWNLHFGWEKVN